MKQFNKKDEQQNTYTHTHINKQKHREAVNNIALILLLSLFSLFNCPFKNPLFG